MRGVWVSSIANIDWPSKQGLSTAELKNEINTIIDRMAAMNMNCIFLQVRPSADALYNSHLEPWSAYLTGVQGVAPTNFDPLSYWIERAHRKGIELHAWINPFRATTGNNQPTAINHVTQAHPEWIIEYENKAYIDPGNKEAREYICNVIEDITSRYNIDGLHIDDYFYPYPAAGKFFNDTASYNAYNPESLSLAAWRRSNINTFIHDANSTIKNIKPWVAFGVSPFGVWRNKKDDPRGSATTAGTTAYEGLNADILEWIDKKWVDYVIPQIYWETTHPAANFNTLADWWANQRGASIYIGHGIYKINNGTETWNDPDEMARQMDKVRKTKNLDGSVFFSYKQFNRNINGFDSLLAHHYYTTKALVPPTIKNNIKTTYNIRLTKKRHILRWNSENSDNIRFYIVYRHTKKDNFNKNNSNFIVDITDKNLFVVEAGEKRMKYYYRVAPIDKYGQEMETSKAVKIKY